MNKPKLHFSHANSYPAGTYRRLFELLGEHYDIQALDMHAHNPQYPVQTGWPHQVKELVDELTARYTEPVILVGHSLGGMLSLMVAATRPDLVRCVLMLDSPVVAGWRAMLLRVMRRLPIADRLSPARFSARRRNVWPDAQAAYEHFASKDIFQAWAPGVLQDYIDAGLKPHPEGVQLRYSRENETEVYRALPHHIGALVKRGLRVPAGFIGGTESVENRQAGLEATRRLVRRNMRMVPGGHLFPMEDPQMTAAAAHEMIVRLLSQVGAPARIKRRRRY
ncbi:alpha/beta fold hydrolase [Pseudoduganella namucuonensis]|uniref:Pimeloyl-ACP methyl ester carboxylesterase n=1 Tax=Pseudoduganella namucuonensis TaxID=1035707 RepID=A0A1I7HPF5_9BURK|nr:alpha/beta hydrolase [Pseudoduganella namucuonensis]SFU62608.1 Pimeloyl-ACP methyl ester carboxylesterase [Pseudoduganella namucuonensis]